MSEPYSPSKTRFCNFIRVQIGLFCETSFPASPSSFILWDTLEDFPRGQKIPYTKDIKNKYMSEMEELEADILKLEKEFQQSKFKEVHQLLVHKKLRYNKLHT